MKQPWCAWHIGFLIYKHVPNQGSFFFFYNFVLQQIWMNNLYRKIRIIYMVRDKLPVQTKQENKSQPNIKLGIQLENTKTKKCSIKQKPKTETSIWKLTLPGEALHILFLQTTVEQSLQPLTIIWSQIYHHVVSN